MKKFLKAVLKPFYWFANCVWWVKWSNIRWKEECLCSERVQDAHKPQYFSQISPLVRTLYHNFTWTKDGADQLGDAICPPDYNYRRWLEGELKDDCDGFHSLVYHCLTSAGFTCYLLSVCELKDGHCVLLFKFKDKWYVNDYTWVSTGYSTAKEAIEMYNERYIQRYNSGKGFVVYNALISFDYTLRKFKAEKLKNIK